MHPKHRPRQIAAHGFIKLTVARHVWWLCCGGRGIGNVAVVAILYSFISNDSLSRRLGSSSTVPTDEVLRS